MRVQRLDTVVAVIDQVVEIAGGVGGDPRGSLNCAGCDTRRAVYAVATTHSEELAPRIELLDEIVDTDDDVQVAKRDDGKATRPWNSPGADPCLQMIESEMAKVVEKLLNTVVLTVGYVHLAACVDSDHVQAMQQRGSGPRRIPIAEERGKAGGAANATAAPGERLQTPAPSGSDSFFTSRKLA